MQVIRIWLEIFLNSMTTHEYHKHLEIWAEWLTADYRNFIAVLYTWSSEEGVATLQYHQIITVRTVNITHEKIVGTIHSIPVGHRVSHNWNATQKQLQSVQTTIVYLNTHESADDLEWLNAPEYPNWWQITLATIISNSTSPQMYPQLFVYTCTRPDE